MPFAHDQTKPVTTGAMQVTVSTKVWGCAILAARQSLGTAAVSLLSNGELDALALGQRDPRLLGANDEHVGLPRRERVVNGVLEMDNVEPSIVALTVRDDANAAHVAATRHHGNDTGLELDEARNLARGQVNLDRVIDLDDWVRVADAALGTHSLVSGG